MHKDRNGKGANQEIYLVTPFLNENHLVTPFVNENHLEQYLNARGGGRSHEKVRKFHEGKSGNHVLVITLVFFCDNRQGLVAWQKCRRSSKEF